MYASHFLALLALDSASVCIQISLTVKLSVSRDLVYLMLQQTESEVGLELRAYTQVICSLSRLQLHPSASRWEPPCPACVGSHLAVMEKGSCLWLGVGGRLRNISELSNYTNTTFQHIY